MNSRRSVSSHRTICRRASLYPSARLRDGLVDHVQYRRGRGTDDLTVPGADDGG